MGTVKDIFTRELVLRTGKVRLVEEYSILGESENTVIEVDHVIFKTTRYINKIFYIALNGHKLIAGKDYSQEDELNIRINKNALTNFADSPGQTVLSISYFYAPKPANT